MSLILHHLKKDIRCLRLLLLLWFILLLVNSLVMRSGLDRLHPSDEGTEVLAAAYVLLYVLQQILQIVIVCQLVQADALAGTTAFWLTRPISRKELLLSKSLFVLLILVLPSLIAEGIVLQINGISVSQTLSVLPPGDHSSKRLLSGTADVGGGVDSEPGAIGGYRCRQRDCLLSDSLRSPRKCHVVWYSFKKADECSLSGSMADNSFHETICNGGLCDLNGRAGRDGHHLSISEAENPQFRRSRGAGDVSGNRHSEFLVLGPFET